MRRPLVGAVIYHQILIRQFTRAFRGPVHDDSPERAVSDIHGRTVFSVRTNPRERSTKKTAFSGNRPRPARTTHWIYCLAHRRKRSFHLLEYALRLNYDTSKKVKS